MPGIHPSAVIDRDAEIGSGCQVGPFVVIEAGVQIGEDNVIEAGAHLYSGLRMGQGNLVGHGAILGGLPQDLQFDRAAPTGLIIGDGNQIREYATLHRSTRSDVPTRIGDCNLFMAYTHVAHDCQIGHRNVLANAATLAGFVQVADWAFLSGHIAVHQFCRIGSHALIAGVSGVPRDVPPYALVDGHRAVIVGQNRVGLKRRGFTLEQRNRIRHAYHLLQLSPSLAQGLAALRALEPCDEYQSLIDFIAASERGLLSFRR